MEFTFDSFMPVATNNPLDYAKSSAVCTTMTGCGVSGGQQAHNAPAQTSIPLNTGLGSTPQLTA